jgi:hypothetical protein
MAASPTDGPGWLPVEKRTTAYYLFENLFRCRVQNIASMSPEYLRFHGMPTCGDPAYDEQMAKELVPRYLSITQMLDYYNRGVTVEIDDPADTKKIYGFISDHLVAWRAQLQREMRKPDEVLVKDLISLDNFANVVYEHAKYHFSESAIDSAFARRIGGLLTLSNSSLLPRPEDPASAPAPGEAEPPGKVYPQRESFRDVFVQHTSTLRSGKWS